MSASTIHDSEEFPELPEYGAQAPFAPLDPGEAAQTGVSAEGREGTGSPAQALSEPGVTGETPWLAGLNEPQREAVLSMDGPVLVLAGAGTGKTSALTARLAHLIATRRAWPSQILAVTFTNKAAREMRERVARHMGEAVEGMPWLGTFHAIGAKFLRRHAEMAGLERNFTIIDTDDQLRLLKQLIQAANLDEKRYPARQLAGCIDRWKNRALNPEDLDAGESEAFAHGRGQELYQQYQQRLKSLNACDFGDLLLHPLNLLRRDRELLEDYQNRFRYIMVDEYQDTNSAQYLWLRLLARNHKNICCVGDDDQSIYSWRGAEVANILRFEKDFPGAIIIRLEQNYRSTPHILAAASGLIAANSARLGKTLWTQSDQGEKLRVISVWDGPEEARLAGEIFERRCREGANLEQCAILVRAQFQTREFEDRFIATGLPYRIIGGFRFYERAEIRDALAYLRVIAQPADDLAFERIVNTPKRTLGAKALEKIHSLARARGLPLSHAAVEICDSDELPSRQRASLTGLMRGFARWRELQHQQHPAELARIMLDESGYTDMLKAEKSADAAGRLENLAELARAMEDYESLGDFLEHVALVMDNESAQSEARLTIMTIHAAKGLEFDHVLLAGWEDGTFPSQRALDEGGLASLEEERRLAYVAITRARQSCTIIHAANRRIYGQWNSAIPSRFVEELPEEHIEMESTLFGDGGQGSGGGRSGGLMDRADPFAHVARDPDRFAHRGPGWQRGAQAAPDTDFYRAVPPPAMRPARKSGISMSTRARGDISIGMRVKHSKFGAGTVTAQDGNKLEIEFDDAGHKRVLDSFIQPE